MKKDVLSIVAIVASICAIIVSSIAITRSSAENQSSNEIDKINARISLLGEEVGENNLDHVDDIGNLMEAVLKIEEKVGMPKTDFLARINQERPESEKK